MSERKRKLRELHSSAPDSKRQRKSGDQEPDAISIEYLDVEDDKLPPVLAFANGFNLPDIPLKAYVKKDANLPLSKQQLVLHSSEHPRMDYMATENFGSGSDTLLDHYVGLYDPKTSHLKVVKVRPMSVHCTLRPSQEEVDEANAAKAYQTSSAMRHNLGMEFGTKKAKKMIVSLTENALIQSGAKADGKLDLAAQVLVNSVGKSVASMPSAKEMAADAEAAKPKPRADLEAKSAADVYPIHTLIPPDVLDSIEVQDWIEKTKSKELTVRSGFVGNKRWATAISKKDMRAMRVLKYMAILVDFFQALKGNPKRGQRVPPKAELRQRIDYAPDFLVDGVRKRFCMDGEKELGPWESDFLITNLAAMSLFVDNYETNITDLRNDLRLENGPMVNYFRELGCKISSRRLDGRSVTVAKLEIPLQFPESGKARNRKRR